MAEVSPHNNGMNPPVLILSACDKGNGLGHLKRSLHLASQLGEGACLYLSDTAVPDMLLGSFPPHRLLHSPGNPADWDYVIIDKRAAALSDILPFLESRVPVIGIDEGGPARQFCTFLADTLPFPGSRQANICSPAFLPLPGNVPLKREAIKRVLISYGGEDPAQLTGKTAKLLIEKGYFSPGQITAVIGPFFKELNLPTGVTKVSAPETLVPLYRENDLVFTSFGLTPYEAASSGVPVLVLNPTGYHRKCTRLAGFPDIGVKDIDTGKLRFYLENRELLVTRSAAPLPDSIVSLAETIASLKFPASAGCPACGTAWNRAVARYPEKSFFTCSNCKALYSIPFTQPEEYSTEYFFSEYKQQYGKTYLQDYGHILKLGKKRMGRISPLLDRKKSGPPPALLDIGCAFGPFLEAARDGGCRPYGIDVSLKAVKYTAENLNIPTAAVSFQEFESLVKFQRDSYDIITMWYVIEHMKDLKASVAKIHSLLKPGGVFAFSTPNRSGISGKRDLQKYLKTSPQDHVTLLSPGWAGRYLKRGGFNVKRICITGHHPERFPGMTGMSGKTSGLLGFSYGVISKLFRLGETFEMYAVKR